MLEVVIPKHLEDRFMIAIRDFKSRDKLFNQFQFEDIGKESLNNNHIYYLFSKYIEINRILLFLKDTQEIMGIDIHFRYIKSINQAFDYNTGLYKIPYSKFSDNTYI